MLDHFKRRVAAILAIAKMVTLSTSGPAGIQARTFPCESKGVHLYLLLPVTSDHLLNLEQESAVVASTPGWQLRGTAQVLQLTDGPRDLLLLQSPAAIGCVLVKIHPVQMQVYRQDSWGFKETIDF